MYKHAVFAQQDDRDYYQIIDGGHPTRSLYAPTLLDLHAWMDTMRIDVLWAMPGERLEKVIRAEHFLDLQSEEYNVYVPPDCREKRPLYGASIRRTEKDAFNRYFMFPGNREWKQPANHDRGVWFTPEPENLLNTVHYLQREYQVPVVWSPSHIGMDTLKLLHREDHIEIQGLDEKQLTIFLDNVARDACNSISWASKANLERGTHIFGFDKNGQFLGAAQSVDLGNGPFHKTRKWEPLLAGFWYFHVENHRGSFNGEKLPRILDRDEGWAHTDLINVALRSGTMLSIQGGYVWQERDKYLERWAKHLWQHRTALREDSKNGDTIARSNAVGTAKMIPNTAVGLFMRLGRPHWNYAIAHRAMANQAYSLARIHREFGILPCLVSKDAFYFASCETDPRQVVPGLLDHEKEQRGYKLIGQTPITEEIIAAFGRINDRKFGVPGIEGTIVRSMRNGANA